MSLNKKTLEEIKLAVKESFSSAQACRILGLTENGSTATRLRKIVAENNIDISHWTGQLWSKGKTALDDPRIREKSTENIFTINSDANASYVRSLILKKNLLEYKCTKCNNDGTWNGEDLTLQLDHINGIRTDQRLENLRWLCPNCHSQTDTYTSKNRNHTSKKKVSDEALLTAVTDSANIYQALKKVGLQNGRNYARVKKLLKQMGE